MFNIDDVTVADQPRGDRIVVLPILKGSANIIVDMSENREQPEKGVVLAVRPGAVGSETGRFVPVLSQRGNLVSYGRNAGMGFQIVAPQAELAPLIMRDCEVLVARKPGTDELEVHERRPPQDAPEGADLRSLARRRTVAPTSLRPSMRGTRCCSSSSPSSRAAVPSPRRGKAASIPCAAPTPG